MDFSSNDPGIYFDLELHAIAGVSALYDVLSSTSEDQFKRAVFVKETLKSKHPHNTILKNTTDYFLFGLSKHNFEKDLLEKKQEILKDIKKSKEELSENLSKKIRPGQKIFLHSINQTMCDSLIKTSKHKQFFINLLDHVPFNSGEHFSKQFIKHNIPVNKFSDLMYKAALKESDICFFGPTATLKDGAGVFLFGTEAIAEEATRLNIPTYACSLTWSHTKKPNKEKYLEALDPSLLTGHITELGIFNPEFLDREIRFHRKGLNPL